MKESNKYRRTTETQAGFEVSGLKFKGPVIYGWVKVGTREYPTKWDRETGHHDSREWDMKLRLPYI